MVPSAQGQYFAVLATVDAMCLTSCSKLVYSPSVCSLTMITSMLLCLREITNRKVTKECCALNINLLITVTYKAFWGGGGGGGAIVSASAFNLWDAEILTADILTGWVGISSSLGY